VADSVDSSPRPDLSRILSAPVLPSLGRELGSGTGVDASSFGPDFLLAVDRERGPGPEDAGFGIAQAVAVAERLRERLGPAPSLLPAPPARPALPNALHDLENDRAAALLFERD